MYKFIFLDLDDTILDFHKAERIALSRALREMGIDVTEAILARYSEINRAQWELLQTGELTRPEVLVRRFRLLYEELGIEASAGRTQSVYEQYLSEGHYFLPGAEELLRELAARGCRLFLASNGNKNVQKGRLASAGIAPLFEGIFISEDIGAVKPERAYFDACFAAIPDLNKEEAIMLGDSLTSDILGGINAGIATCHYDPTGEVRREDIPPDYRITHLLEFLPIVDGIL